MRRVGAAAALAVAALASVVLVRTLAVGSRRGPAAPPAPPAADVDGGALAQRLAAGVRLRTVSHEEEGRVEADAFRAFRQLLAADYPRAHRALTREIVAGHSLLYTWPGRDPASPGVLLAAHQDVVPAPDAADWTHPPFAGEVAGGAVWGRGAMDDKGSAAKGSAGASWSRKRRVGGVRRAVVANLWLTWPLVAAGADRVPALDAMLRTTTAATVFHAGVKANVLPREAEAIVNFRILPGDRVEDVLAHVRRTVDDERVQVEATRVPREASPVSPTDSEAFASLRRVISASFPDALVTPYLVLGGTDARHYAGLTDDVYRFGPFRYGADALKLAHGRDERISIDNLVQGVRFYRALLRELASKSRSPTE